MIQKGRRRRRQRRYLFDKSFWSLQLLSIVLALSLDAAATSTTIFSSSESCCRPIITSTITSSNTPTLESTTKPINRALTPPAATAFAAFLVPRGGGGEGSGSRTITTTSSSTNISKDGVSTTTTTTTTTVTILEVLKFRRRINWLRLLRTILFATSVISIWEAYNSIGVPFATSIWNLLHDASQNPMPYFYYPSQQDLRVATTIAKQTGPISIPDESLPATLETTLAILSTVFYILMQFICPLAIRKWLRYKPLVVGAAVTLPANNDSLAVVVELVQEEQQSKNNKDKTITKKKKKRSVAIRKLRLPQDEDDDDNKKKKKKRDGVSYEFDLKNKGYQWNPSNDKLSC